MLPSQNVQRRFSRRQPPSLRRRHPWLTPLVSLASVVNLSALGYRIVEGWDWGDSYWMVLITISTIGYGEVNPLTAAGRAVTVFSIVGGLVVVQLSIQSLLGLSESGYFRRMRENRFRRYLQTMENHVILCGYGRIGREIAEQLASEGVPLIVIEMDQAQKEAAEARGIVVLQSDATLDETLLEAGIHRCRSLVAALPSNAANLYVVLSARGIAPACRLIARSDSEEAERKLLQAGANQVVSPYVAGGRTMAATALRPLAVRFMDLLSSSDCEVEEFQLSEDGALLGDLNGRSLAELELGRRSGAMVLAIRTPAPKVGNPYSYRGATYQQEESKLIANPGGEVRLAPGQMLVVMGSQEQLGSFIAILGKALVAVEAMAG
ncbi:potassium channel protein [Synechococcus sp. CS-602]|uniref:potassium channel protein n=1 Tax=Synechococcaceae TaxID=1890426 RepID=UPI0008FF4AE4|nr:MULTISPECIES: potassium channel protein [Synechococcaceae]MCT4365534.1 potassium channel protein [Candidatus Regnicoccus frigidus MAG-AL1]APD47455.1 VIC family potassium channel protein [Synechococcus sp. SynAce01]MCT0202600.1 potassium channel protein [Synechococcus sp. CS-603]MCT0204404.1 potassium channel protein [Synechococcus sp. CS-602]MCT0247246.1 potassium channel protein [Synechococcus sp. CS-601]